MDYRLVVVILVIGVLVGYSASKLAGELEAKTTTVEKIVTVTETAPPTVQTMSVTIVETTTTLETKTLIHTVPVLVDAVGNTLQLSEYPERVASLAPSITETICILGECSRVVAVDSFSKKVEGLPGDVVDVGGYWSPSLEAILSVDPDIVFLCSGVPPHEHIGRQLIDQGVLVFYLRCDRSRHIDDIVWDIESIAKILGVESKTLVSSIRERASRLVEQITAANLTPYSVALVVYMDEKSVWVAGGGTFQDYVLNMAGGANVFSELYGWQMVGFEHLVAENPDYVFITTMGPGDVERLKSIVERTPLADSEAYTSGRICVLYGEAADVISRPGPRLADAAYLLAWIMYRDKLGISIPGYLEGSYVCLGG